MAFVSSSFYSTKSDERKAYQYERSPFTSVSMSAINYQVTDRILTLAKPKFRKETTIRDGFCRYLSDPTYSGATKTAVRAQCSPRVIVLAAPMKHETYKYELPLPRPVPPNALKYNVTARVSELAIPKKLPGVL